jgi:phenylpropionate dioxygenase-like ring-hydroxylating dioxygenase large terminal subunit
VEVAVGTTDRYEPGWVRVAGSDEVGTSPIEVRAGEREWVLYRADAQSPVVAVEARCPHRLTRLSRGTVVDGTLQCPYHGWRFAADGGCVRIPSAGPQGSIPPRAKLLIPVGVREVDGAVWLAPFDDEGGEDLDEDLVSEPDLRATSEVLTNLDPSLAYGWHAVALVDEVPVGVDLVVRLLGRSWVLRRSPSDEWSADPQPAGLQHRFGVVWLAPLPPRVELLEAPDDADPAYAQGWLVPEACASPAGVLAENFLDVAHFPFVHVATFGAAEQPYVEPFEVSATDDELTSVQVQWFDNPEDPGVLAGQRPVRQRRRAGYTYRWPFQLQLRLEELDAGAVKTILFFLQPQDDRSTRIYTKMLLHGIGGVATPSAEVVAREVAFEVAVLAEDLVLQQAMTVTGLPLRLRDELHVRADRSGVALRRILSHHQGV